MNRRHITVEVRGYDDRPLVVGARVLLHPHSQWRERGIAYGVVTRINTRGAVAVIVESDAPGGG